MLSVNPLEQKRKELLYKSTHRGTKENDILLGDFARQALVGMSENELQTYASFLEISDQVLFAWMIGQEEPVSEYKELVYAIRNMHK